MQRQTILAMSAVLIVTVVLSGIIIAGSEDASAESVTNESDLKSALAAGGEVILESDIALTGMVSIPRGVSATLDLNGHTISATDGMGFFMLVAYGDLTIRDSSPGGTGTITSNGDQVLVYVVSGSNSVIESGNFIRDCDETVGVYVVQVFGNLTVNGGTFLHNQGCGIAGIGGLMYLQYNGGSSSPAEMTVNGGVFKSTTYGFILFGDGNKDACDNAVVTINDADVEAPMCISTNASGGVNAGHTTNVNGGTFRGDYGIYAPSYGIYNISGGTIEANTAGVQIASGVLNVSGEAVISVDASPNYDSLVGPSGSGPGTVTGAIVVGKHGSGYVFDIEINIDGGTIVNTNPDGNAVVICDDSLAVSGANSNPIGNITVNATAGKVAGNVVLTNINNSTTTQKPDSSKIVFSLDGATVEGDISMPEDFKSKVDVVSGVVTGNVPADVTVPASSGTVTYSWTGQSYTYFGGSFSISADAPVRQGSTLEGYRVSGSSTIYQMGDKVTASGNVTVTPVWSSNAPPIIFDDDEEEEFIGGTAGSEGKDDSTTIVACAAAAVVAALMAAFLILDRRP